MIELGKVETLELSDKDFVGPIVGVCAVSEDKASETLEVSFEDFVVDSA
jgi:hypothetical protein